MEIAIYESYQRCHEVAVQRLGYSQALLDNGTDEVAIQNAIIDLSRYISANAYRLKAAANAVPPGFWYMATVTQPSNHTEADAVRLHEISMEFFKSAGVKVYLASLEHSNIWHIHYLICCSNYSKNLPRDLGKATGTRVAIERKITDAKRWNGACNYIVKRNYPDDKTHQRILVEELEYSEGKGWGFKT